MRICFEMEIANYSISERKLVYSRSCNVIHCLDGHVSCHRSTSLSNVLITLIIQIICVHVDMILVLQNLYEKNKLSRYEYI